MGHSRLDTNRAGDVAAWPHVTASHGVRDVIISHHPLRSKPQVSEVVLRPYNTERPVRLEIERAARSTPWQIAPTGLPESKN